MTKYSIVLCVAFAFAACHLSEVATTPLPPLRTYEDGDSESQEDLQLKKISLPKNKIRTKRGIPCSRVEDTDCEWEINPPCTCDPCDAVRHANEARMLRKQQRKIVTEMKINRLKRKLHTAVCPSCALAHEREREHKPCNKPHVDITVVVPNGNQHGGSEVPAPMVEYPSLPPPRQTYTQAQVVQTGSQMFTSDPLYDEPMVPQYGPMVPEPQYEPMVQGPQFEPMVPRPQYGTMVPEAQFEPMVPQPQSLEGFGAAAQLGMRSAGDTAERKRPTEEVFEQDKKRRIQKSEGLLTIFVENQNTTTTEAPNDAWPFQNGTHRPYYAPNDAWPFQNGTRTPYYAPNDAWPFQNGTHRPYYAPNDAWPFQNGTHRPYYAPNDAWPFQNGTRRPYYAAEVEMQLPSPKDTMNESVPYDLYEAVPLPFNYNGSPKTYDSGETGPVNYTWSPREYDSNEAVPINYTESQNTYDSTEAVPFNYTEPPKAGRYARDETSLRAPPTDEVLWQTAYLAASKAVASALNKSFSIDTLKSSDSSAVKRNCTGSQCMTVCLESGCLKNEVRQKRDTSSRMPFASALLTGLVSAVIGL